MFDYDWFHGQAFEQQINEAKWRCTLLHHPEASRDQLNQKGSIRKFHDELEVRQLVYLRDGFSYEIKQLSQVASKANLVFECEPVDEQYKVGAFVVTVPFDEIVRVEVFACHPTEKPAEMHQITGFRTTHEQPEPRHR